MDGIVYHIPNPLYPEDTSQGYIGVVKSSKGLYRRFREHATGGRLMQHMIRENSITYEDLKIIFEGDIKECYRKEAELRPRQLIGWNIAAGGGGPYYSVIEDLSKFRSNHQKERMKSTALRQQQGEAFKKNYYSNTSAIELRRKRARELMADETKKQKCLAAMHKKVKCPFCEYENNAGNVAQHIKRKHND